MRRRYSVARFLEKLERIPGIVREIVESREQLRFDRAHFMRLGESSLDFEAIWFVLSSEMVLHMDLQQAVLLDLLRRFEAEGIEIAYPSRTLFLAGGPAPGTT